MATKTTYRILRGAAIGLGSGLTAYSGWLSWTLHYDPMGPIAAITGAGLFIFAEHSWQDRRKIKAGLLFGLGLLALVISGTAVWHRVAASQETRLQATRSDNLPRIMAEQAVTDAKEMLGKATDDAQQECRSGRRAKCEGAEQREEAARRRVEEARTKLAGLGAKRDEDPGAASMATLIPWLSIEAYQRAAPALLPLWLELAAPLLLSLGLSPGRHAPAAVKRKKRAKRKRAPRKPPASKKPAESATVLPLFDKKRKAS